MPSMQAAGGENRESGERMTVTKSQPWHCVCGREFWDKPEFVKHIDRCGVFNSDLKNPYAQLVSVRAERDTLARQLADARELLQALYNYAGGPLYELADSTGLVPGMDRTTLGDVWRYLHGEPEKGEATDA